MCVCLSVFMCMPRGQWRLAGVLFTSSSAYSSETGTLSEPGARPTANRSHWSLCLPPTVLGLQVCGHAGLSKREQGVQTHFLMLGQQAVLRVSHLRSPKILPATSASPSFHWGQGRTHSRRVVWSCHRGRDSSTLPHSAAWEVSPSILETQQTQVLGLWTRKAF